MTRSVGQSERGRPFCYRCHKPRLTCICEQVTRVQNRTPVWIVQHPRERFHPIGTARIARLGLERVFVDVRHRGRVGPPRGFPSGAALLYPKKGARPLSEVGQRAPEALVVLDGTWAHARTLFRDNPWLHDLPRFGLEPPRPSQYRIRREPAPQCVSTIESVVYALSRIEPDTHGLDGLLDAFAAMIDEQIRIYRERRDEPGAARSMRKRRPLLGVTPERVVLVEAEAVSIPGDRERRRELVHWCAVRPATGDTFERLLCPEHPPRPLHLFHMGLDETELAAGVSPAALEEDWRRFLRPGDVVVGWTKSTVDVRPPDGGAATRVLKSTYCNVRRGARGTLEQMLAREGLTLPALGIRGRAGMRLASALAMYELVRGLTS
jgi:DTW domain-containing protein YfiP